MDEPARLWVSSLRVITSRAHILTNMHTYPHPPLNLRPNSKVNCEIIIQYACEDTLDVKKVACLFVVVVVAVVYARYWLIISQRLVQEFRSPAGCADADIRCPQGAAEMCVLNAGCLVGTPR
jgi:hypothetical protein